MGVTARRCEGECIKEVTARRCSIAQIAMWVRLFVVGACGHDARAGKQRRQWWRLTADVIRKDSRRFPSEMTNQSAMAGGMRRADG